MYGLAIVIVIIINSIIILLWLVPSLSASFPVIIFCAPLGRASINIITMLISRVEHFGGKFQR